ncbi:MAG: hypothetical protein SPI58_03510 [Candidatus Enteromonas sp.]|nr:hypothetical protein [Candidatus Enteromonas sp.]
MRFALCFCNRGFMPGELILGARKDMAEALTKAGHEYLMMDENATRYGGVETRDEGRLYHDWLKSHEGEYDGVIFSLPIFADENGAVEALKDAGVPILIQAYPDEIGKMDFAHRRDAYCGKFSVTDVFTQYGIPFTVLKPHVVHPLSEAFQDNLREFAAICRVVGGMKRFTVGCIGARTTAFKTTRFDEIALQKYGITVESFDLSELIFKVQHKEVDAEVEAKMERLSAYTDCSACPSQTRNLGEDLRGHRRIHPRLPFGLPQPPLLERDGTDSARMPLRLAFRAERSRNRRQLRNRSLQRDHHAGHGPRKRATDRGARLEQQLRGRREQSHPLPLRARRPKPDDPERHPHVP